MGQNIVNVWLVGASTKAVVNGLGNAHDQESSSKILLPQGRHMTARASITQAALDRAARVATERRVVVTFTTKDGTTCTIAPLDAKPPADADFIKWSAK